MLYCEGKVVAIKSVFFMNCLVPVWVSLLQVLLAVLGSKATAQVFDLEYLHNSETAIIERQ